MAGVINEVRLQPQLVGRNTGCNKAAPSEIRESQQTVDPLPRSHPSIGLDGGGRNSRGRQGSAIAAMQNATPRMSTDTILAGSAVAE